MPAASIPKDGSPKSLTNPRYSQTPQWPLIDNNPSPAASGGDGGDAVGRQHEVLRGVQQPRGGAVGDEEQQQQQQPPPSSPGAGKKQAPWWKTRKAVVSFAVGGVLLVALVVLLVLGLLGYLRKVGPFASLVQNGSSAATAPNPLSTIPLMSDPFANPPATSNIPIPIPTPTPSSTIAQAPLSVSVVANPAPTNLPTINAVRINSVRTIWTCEQTPFPLDATTPLSDVDAHLPGTQRLLGCSIQDGLYNL